MIEFVFLLFVSQLFVYIGCAIMKKRVNRWVSLGYTVLDVVLAFPIGFIVLFMAVMGTDSGTDEAIRASTIFVIISAGVYLTIFTVSLIQTIKAFKAFKASAQRVPKEKA